MAVVEKKWTKEEAQYLKKRGKITRKNKARSKNGNKSHIEDGAGLKIAILDGNMEINKKYRIRKLGHVGKNETGEFIGELIQKTKYFYTFKNDERAESFLKVDFVIGEYTIDEIRRNKNE